VLDKSVPCHPYYRGGYSVRAIHTIVWRKGSTMALLRLNDQGRLYLKSAGKEQLVEIPQPKEVLLLLDTSGSMAGDKILQAKNGANDFCKSAIQRGHSAGLAVFGDRAASWSMSNRARSPFASRWARKGAISSGWFYARASPWPLSAPA